jgi:hypothetical protein
MPDECDEGCMEFMSRAVNCFAVTPTYLEAREPGVILLCPGGLKVGRLGLAPGVAFARERDVGVVAGVPLLEDIRLDVEKEGVIRPLIDAVETDGVIRPEIEGVIRPPREDATDGGRDIELGPVVGALSFVEATKTPQLGAHEK